MEQLDQLKTMRDQAAQRLEEARAALERSPDAKLVNSLSSLIEDLEQSLGLVGEPSVEVTDEVLEPQPGQETATEAEATTSDEPDPITEKMEEAARNAADDTGEFSLEESLEAELLSGDESIGEYAKNKDA